MHLVHFISFGVQQKKVPEAVNNPVVVIIFVHVNHLTC